MNSLALNAWSTFAGLFPVKATKIQYYKTKKSKLHLDNPVLFDEKLSYLKLYRYADDPLAIKCADKYAVREFVEKRGCRDSLNELYGVWEKAEDIPFDKLPSKFVLKCTHGCHMNIICTDKRDLNREETIATLTSWMSDKQWKIQQELHYRHIKPRIICEKYLEPAGGGYSTT